jgi:uracil-DNA glycosylase
MASTKTSVTASAQISAQTSAKTKESTIRLEPGWLTRLEGEFAQAYMQNLKAFLRAEQTKGKTVYPAGSDYFSAFDHTPIDKVKVVILGQDPYHGPEQAHGLCFSVPPGLAQPPSLVNIFKEIDSDLGLARPRHGCLHHWADQGVLLLNSVLTVERGRAASHQGKGWEEFTDKVIHVVNDQCDGVVFMLWGAYAQRKGAFIDRQRHLVLTAPHPSPLSAHRGFFGCRHFSKANSYLQARGEAAIDWSLPPI